MAIMKTEDAAKLPWAHEELGAHPERANLEGKRAPNARVREHLELTQHERDQGYKRPLWHTYQHALCGLVQPLRYADAAREFARNPERVGPDGEPDLLRAKGGLWCDRCQALCPIGPDGQLFWVDTQGRVTPVKVGT